MSEENIFTDEEESRILELLFETLSKPETEREPFLKKECGDNHRMFQRVMADLEEIINGESRPVIKDGEEIGNYVIMGKINKGGFATVYRAEHKILKTLAAIKVFDKLDIDEAEKDLIWNKDSKSLSKFYHDNIVKFYDVGFYEKDEKRLPYIIVELIKGKHLDEFCKAKDHSLREVLNLFRSLCSVIEYIHRKEKILHLDLKPSNILVTSNRPNRIKLIDFGSSKIFRSESGHLTRTDFTPLLSPRFASPEQFDNDEEIDHRSDIYSLGVVLYLILTEKVPFGDGETDDEKIKRDVMDKMLKPVLPSQRVLKIEKKIKFGLPPRIFSQILAEDLDDIIMKCLEKHPRNRYNSVSELNQDIDNFLRGKPIKAGEKDFFYKTSKTFAQFLGLKGGLSGWAKWKTPLKRSAALVILLTLLGFIGNEIYNHFLVSLYPPITKTVVKAEKAMPLRTKSIKNDLGETSQVEKQHWYIYCKEKEEEEGNCFTFFEIPAGSFQMGRRENENFSSEDDQNPEEVEKQQRAAEPVHTVTLAKFHMARFEVTNKQWNIVAKSDPVNINLDVTNDHSSLPKTNISYSEVREFCDRLTRDLREGAGGKTITVRLPSEAEWEYACRAGNYTKFGGGNNFAEDFVNAIKIPEEPTTPEWAKSLIKKIRTNPLPDSNFVGNPYGLSAMNGNVWEMVSDSWHPSYEYSDKDGNYHKAPENGSSWDVIDLRQNNRDGLYVLRGGAFNRLDYMSQCSYRTDGRFISAGNDQTGFRIVLEGVD